jgi:ABC-type transporter Mla subunit MlaD
VRWYESPVAKNSRVPQMVGSIPVVGDLMKSADAQAQWMQDLLEQNARLVGQLPVTLKTFNDSLERFNQTVGRLDKAVQRIESATTQVLAPLEQLNLRELPDLVEALRKEALPALRAATDTQRQVALLSTTVDRVITLLAELPGAGILRRFTTSSSGDVPAS